VFLADATSLNNALCRSVLFIVKLFDTELFSNVEFFVLLKTSFWWQLLERLIPFKLLPWLDFTESPSIIPLRLGSRFIILNFLVPTPTLNPDDRANALWLLLRLMELMRPKLLFLFIVDI
jgi:hypothetical protein